MPWTVNQEMLEKFGAIVFNTDPNNVLDLDSPLNQWNLIDPNQDPNDLANIQYSDIDGEYCARWMNSPTTRTSPRRSTSAAPRSRPSRRTSSGC